MDETTILPDGLLTPGELDQRRKGEALVARIEELFQTDESFREWFLDGFRDIEDGNYFRMSYDEETDTWMEQEYRNGILYGEEKSE